MWGRGAYGTGGQACWLWVSRVWVFGVKGCGALGNVVWGCGMPGCVVWGCGAYACGVWGCGV